MSNTNQHNRHVEILAEETHRNEFFLTSGQDDECITPNQALSAIQRAVEECVKPLTEDEAKELERLRECVKDPTKAMSQEQQNRLNFLAYKEWNILNVCVDSLKSELTTLRTELERVKKYARHTDGCHHDFYIFEPLYTCTCGMEGGRDEKPQHKGGCHIYMQGGECNCDLL
jgi:hypothetical protein